MLAQGLESQLFLLKGLQMDFFFSSCNSVHMNDTNHPTNSIIVYTFPVHTYLVKCFIVVPLFFWASFCPSSP